MISIKKIRYRIKNGILYLCISYLAFIIFSCAQINLGHNKFIELRNKVSQGNVQIRTDGYYYAEKKVDPLGDTCNVIYPIIFIKGGYLRLYVGYSGNALCQDTERGTKDDSFESAHLYFQKNYKKQVFYNSANFWGIYREFNGDIEARVFGIGGSCLPFVRCNNFYEFKGKAISSKEILLNGEIYKFREFDFDIDTSRVPLLHTYFKSKKLVPIHYQNL